jgi:tight adherence protein C
VSAAGALPVVVGVLLGVGIVLVVTASPGWRRPSLAERVGPYLGRGTLSRPAPRRTDGRLSSGIRGLARRLDRVSVGSGGARRRLDQLGAGLTLEQLRVEQVTWGLVTAAGAVLVVAVRSSIAGYPGTLPGLLLVATAAAAGVVGRDRWLTHQVSRRRDRIRAELPTIAELLALAVAAGEGATGALERVAGVAHGELADELRRALGDLRSGSSLIEALESVAARLDLPELGRFVDGIAVAVDRGTPLSSVLQAQAADVREAHRRELIEIGGRRDIAMMVPVVFLVLPLSVLFALFPGFYGITLSAP